MLIVDDAAECRELAAADCTEVVPDDGYYVETKNPARHAIERG